MKAPVNYNSKRPGLVHGKRLQAFALLFFSCVFFVLPDVPQGIFAQGAQKQPVDDWAEITKKAMPGVVSIQIFDGAGNPLGLGSGFIVQSDGVIVTNYHVIEGAHAAKVITKQGETFEVKGVSSFDTTKDFAILRIPAIDLPALPLANSNTVEVGEAVLAIGDPKGFTGSVSSGILSAKTREERGSTWLQTTTPVSQGNSGGPLLNRRGEVIGVISWGRTDGQNLNFAVPINYVRGELQLGTSIKYSLAQLAQAEEELAKLRSQKEAEEIRKAFTLYEDTNGMFKLLVPKAWRTQQARKTSNEGVTSFETMFAPPDAAKAEVDGYLSEGIRVQIELPPAGASFQTAFIQSYRDGFPEMVLKGNPGFELTNTGMFILNGLSVKVFTFEGKGPNMPERERSIHYLMATEKFALELELVAPLSKVKLLDLLGPLAKTLELSGNFNNPGPAPDGLSGGGSAQLSGPITFGEVELSYKSNMFDDTILKATRFLQSNPNHAGALAYLGFAHLAKRDVQQATFSLEKSLQLGQQLTFPLMRMKQTFLGHSLEPVNLSISKNGIEIASGTSTFRTATANVSNFAIFDYENQCSVAGVEGVFTETFPNSSKTKQELKKFVFFPSNATLKEFKKGYVVNYVAACDTRDLTPTLLVKLLPKIVAAP